MALKHLPPPLPPEERPAGQVVGEAIRAYSAHWVRAIALGLPVALWSVFPRILDEDTLAYRFLPLVGAALLSASYVGAVALVEARPIPLARPLAAGAVVFFVFQFLLVFLVLPAIAWLALVGLVVPVLALEQRSFLDGFRRAFALARADLVHSLGSLAALAIVVVAAVAAMTFVLRDFGDQAVAAAAFIAWLIVSPVFFLGSALLYHDQAARLDSPGRQRRSDADVRLAVDPDRPGSPDAEVEPRAASRGEP
jgi:lysylphosphatidylglycerol synthetase-like protein (DUF2156 family)